MTLIIGSEGSMGRRYQAILKWLGAPFQCYDTKIEPDYRAHPSYGFSNFIIASPTSSHLHWIERLDQYAKPILCEKPLSRSLDEVERILACTSPISMMMQYKYLCADAPGGGSSYNYFRHGGDGMVWDCLQIIALAEGNIVLNENSPAWNCFINGKEIDLRKMDWAYIDAVKDFLSGKYLQRSVMLDWHHKVKKFEDEWTTRQSI